MIKLIADPLVTDIFAKLSVLLSTTNVGALCKNATRIDMSEKLAESNETNARRARRPHASEWHEVRLTTRPRLPSSFISLIRYNILGL